MDIELDEQGLVPSQFERNRPFTADTVFLIRLWYLGRYRGHEAMQRMTVAQIARLLHRSTANVLLALGQYAPCGR